MKVFATIESRRARVTGFKHSGWRIFDDSLPMSSQVRDVDFTIKIATDGADGFLLDYKSTDGELCADSSHPTIEAAFKLASELFGVSGSDWRMNPSSEDAQ